MRSSFFAAYLSRRYRTQRVLVFFAVGALVAAALGSSSAAAQRDPEPVSDVGSGVIDPRIGDEPNRVYSEKLPATVPGECVFLNRAFSATSQREYAGLDTRSALTDRTIEALGMLVTEDEAARIAAATDAQEKVNDSKLHRELQKSLGENYVGTYWEPTQGFVVAHTPTVRAEESREEVARAVGLPSAHLRFVAVEQGVSSEAQESNAKAIAANARELGDLGMRQTFTDESCGHVVVYAEMGSDTTALSERLTAILASGSFSVVEFDSAQDVDFEGDRDDNKNPYIGGALVRPRTGTGGCTSSIGWRKPNGEQWAITAAHCVGTISPDPRPANQYWVLFTQQRNWIQGTQSLNNVRGLTTYLVYGGQLDVAVTWMNAGFTASPQSIYTTLTHPPGVDLTRTMSGWQSSSNADNATDDNPWGYPGDTVCHSGRTWNSERCGTLLTRQITQTGVSNLTGLWSHFHDLRQVSTTHRGGDSGGTVWEKTGTGARILAGVSRGPGGATGGNLVYSHVSYIPSKIGLQKPQGL